MASGHAQPGAAGARPARRRVTAQRPALIMRLRDVREYARVVTEEPFFEDAGDYEPSRPLAIIVGEASDASGPRSGPETIPGPLGWRPVCDRRA